MYKFKSNIDFEFNKTSNFVFQNEIAFPSLTSNEAGYVFFHSPYKTFFGWNGSSWLDLAANSSSNTGKFINGTDVADAAYMIGNVGIGTLDPTEKLEVNGKIKAIDINFSGLPTLSAGLSTGDVWNDGGTLKIV